nr:hypothetical protein CFP56_19256 [Quercus suber]
MHGQGRHRMGLDMGRCDGDRGSLHVRALFTKLAWPFQAHTKAVKHKICDMRGTCKRAAPVRALIIRQITDFPALQQQQSPQRQSAHGGYPSPAILNTGSYTFYSGDGSDSSGWPDVDEWLDFSVLWATNGALMNSSCSTKGSNIGDNSPAETSALLAAIGAQANATGVDARFILAVVESSGCVRVASTASPESQVLNPGLMQTHNGNGTCNTGGTLQDPCPDATIAQMVADGTAGTESGDGLQQWTTAVGVRQIRSAESFACDRRVRFQIRNIKRLGFDLSKGAEADARPVTEISLSARTWDGMDKILRKLRSLARAHLPSLGNHTSPGTEVPSAHPPGPIIALHTIHPVESLLDCDLARFRNRAITTDIGSRQHPVTRPGFEPLWWETGACTDKIRRAASDESIVELLLACASSTRVESAGHPTMSLEVPYSGSAYNTTSVRPVRDEMAVKPSCRGGSSDLLTRNFLHTGRSSWLSWSLAAVLDVGRQCDVIEQQSGHSPSLPGHFAHKLRLTVLFSSTKSSDSNHFPHYHRRVITRLQFKQSANMFRQAIARQARLFSTTPIIRKSAVDTAKETVQTADKTVAQQIVKGIESAEQAAGKVKEAAGLSSGEAKGKANEVAGQVKGKAAELEGKAKGVAEEVKGKISVRVLEHELSHLPRDRTVVIGVVRKHV